MPLFFYSSTLHLISIGKFFLLNHLITIIDLILIKEWNRLPAFIIQVGLGVVLLNLLAILAGVSVSKLCKLNIPQQICIAIEVGFQNGALAIVIAAGLLNNPDMAVPGAIYGLFMNLTGFAIIN